MIKEGDLVMVVKPMPCCSVSLSIGRFFVAGKITQGIGKCELCGGRVKGVYTKMTERKYMEVSMLKKLPPMDENETITTQEEIAKEA